MEADVNAQGPDAVSAEPFRLPPLPGGRRMETVDEQVVRAPLAMMLRIAADVERWPDHLRHYRYVRFRSRRSDGGGVVEMSANRPFGVAGWPTWWLSEMAVLQPGEEGGPSIRFRHIGGITKGMAVEWQFAPVADGVQVRIVHVWDGPRWPLIGGIAATLVIGPIFIHGIASRTLAGLASAAERVGAADNEAEGVARG
jgi:hypothetical protein